MVFNININTQIPFQFTCSRCQASARRTFITYVKTYITSTNIHGY